jgi:hypothetical protein
MMTDSELNYKLINDLDKPDDSYRCLSPLNNRTIFGEAYIAAKKRGAFRSSYLSAHDKGSHEERTRWNPPEPDYPMFF